MAGGEDREATRQKVPPILVAESRDDEEHDREEQQEGP
jgi:hypothetical protein